MTGRGVRVPCGHAVERLADAVRGRTLLVFDLLAVVTAAFGSLALRFDQVTAAFAMPAFPVVVGLLLVFRTVASTRLGLYCRRWRHASAPDLLRIASAVALGSVASSAVFHGGGALVGGWWVEGFPRSFWVIEALVATVLLGGVRFGVRALHEVVSDAHAGPDCGDRRATLLYGAGSAGVLVARSAQHARGAGVQPVGFLDDDRALWGGLVAGLRVFGGLGSLQLAVELTGARSLLITMPSAPGTAIRRVVEAALALRLDVRTVPPLTDLLDGSVDAHRVRRVRVEDLLRRPIVTEHADGVEAIIRDRVVLVTGGGGSIGSELARQVYAIGPRRLVLVDRAESPLYLVQRELEMRRHRGTASGELRVHLGNVVSRVDMERLIAFERPDVIFHAAAYKHVPMMEEHPCDATFVNIGGTRVLLDAAAAAGVDRFVFVSTDKAVRPTSVMGASKRIAEMLVADMAHRTGRPYVSVRFGNVLGSTGSVVPIFREQLESGEPLTITHPEMTRYFMTIPEAAWLILDAAALGRDGDLFVLDMGDPVKVVDLARDLVRLAGRDPDGQPMVTVGLRPGEKLHEQLFYDVEHVEPTPSEKVLRVCSTPPPVGLREDVAHMLALANGEHDADLRDRLLEYARSAGSAIDRGGGAALEPEPEPVADGVRREELLGVGAPALR